MVKQHLPQILLASNSQQARRRRRTGIKLRDFSVSAKTKELYEKDVGRLLPFLEAQPDLNNLDYVLCDYIELQVARGESLYFIADGLSGLDLFWPEVRGLWRNAWRMFAAGAASNHQCVRRQLLCCWFVPTSSLAPCNSIKSLLHVWWPWGSDLADRWTFAGSCRWLGAQTKSGVRAGWRRWSRGSSWLPLSPTPWYMAVCLQTSKWRPTLASVRTKVQGYLQAVPKIFSGLM